MLNFEYKGISQGKYVEGEIEALNNAEAAHKLKDQKVSSLQLRYYNYREIELGLIKLELILFEQIDVSMDSELRQSMRCRAGGRSSVPQIFIDDKHIGGCDDLIALELTGHLEIVLKGRD